MGRKRSPDEDDRHKSTPKKSTPVSTSVTPVTCPRCSCRVMQSNATGNIARHYKGDGKTWCE